MTNPPQTDAGMKGRARPTEERKKDLDLQQSIIEQPACECGSSTCDECNPGWEGWENSEDMPEDDTSWMDPGEL